MKQQVQSEELIRVNLYSDNSWGLSEAEMTQTDIQR